MSDTDSPFNAWSSKWMELAAIVDWNGPDESLAIKRVIAHWHAAPPGDTWKRGRDERLHELEARYQRGNKAPESVRRGEHVVEYELLESSRPIEETKILGADLVDGINAIPLTKDVGGGREGNVEADMLLLVRDGVDYRLHLVEVKTRSNNSWYAAVENLRQLRLFKASSEAQHVFRSRAGLDSSVELPVGAMVLAREEFYSSRGRRENSVVPAQRLFARISAEVDDVEAGLAVWSFEKRTVEALPSTSM
jgi:hypothetical protein